MDRPYADITTILDDAVILHATPTLLRVCAQGRFILEIPDMDGRLLISQPRLGFEIEEMQPPSPAETNDYLVNLPYVLPVWNEDPQVTLDQARRVLQAHSALIRSYPHVVLNALMREAPDWPLNDQGAVTVAYRSDKNSCYVRTHLQAGGWSHVSLSCPRLRRALQSLCCIDEDGCWVQMQDTSQVCNVRVPSIASGHARLSYLESADARMTAIDTQILSVITA